MWATYHNVPAKAKVAAQNIRTLAFPFPLEHCTYAALEFLRGLKYLFSLDILLILTYIDIYFKAKLHHY